MQCEFNNLLSRYHDGELTLAQRREFESHLAQCPMCLAELEELRVITISLQTMRLPHVDSRFLAHLDALADRVEDFGVVRLVTRLTAAAAAILVVASVQLAFHRQTATAPTATITVATLSATEKVIVDPESVVSANETAGEVQIDTLVQDLTGGRP